MKHILTLVLLAMQIAVCAAQPTAPLTNPTAESKVLYIVADSCEFYISSTGFVSKKYKDNETYYTLNIPTKDGTFAIGCKEMYLVENGKGYWPIDRVFSKSDLDKTPTIRMKEFAKDKSAKQLQRAYDRWQEEYDYIFVTKCHNPDNDKQERILAVDSYIHKPSKVRYPHYPIDSLTNAIERDVRVVVIDSDKPYAKRVVRDTAYISYAYGMCAQIFNYEFVDHNGEKSLNNFMQTQENLYPLDEANVFTIDRKQFKWDSDVALDLSELASKRDIKDVWSIISTFHKGHILYFIDRAEITKNTMTVRTCNLHLFTTGGFGGIRKKSAQTN